MSSGPRASSRAHERARTRAVRKSMRPFWVFGYGSLMWNPGFATPETRGARLHGWHRAFCIYSEHYRGTPRQPGLILGLLPGGSCRGLRQFAGKLPLAKAVALVRRGNGATGSNLAYVQNTVTHLTEMGLRDRPL